MSEGAPQGLPASFAMDAEDTESLASRNSEVSCVEDMGGDVGTVIRTFHQRCALLPI